MEALQDCADPDHCANCKAAVALDAPCCEGCFGGLCPPDMALRNNCGATVYDEGKVGRCNKEGPNAACTRKTTAANATTQVPPPPALAVQDQGLAAPLPEPVLQEGEFRGDCASCRAIWACRDKKRCNGCGKQVCPAGKAIVRKCPSSNLNDGEKFFCNNPRNDACLHPDPAQRPLRITNAPGKRGPDHAPAGSGTEIGEEGQHESGIELHVRTKLSAKMRIPICPSWYREGVAEEGLIEHVAGAFMSHPGRAFLEQTSNTTPFLARLFSLYLLARKDYAVSPAIRLMHISIEDSGLVACSMVYPAAHECPSFLPQAKGELEGRLWTSFSPDAFNEMYGKINKHRDVVIVQFTDMTSYCLSLPAASPILPAPPYVPMAGVRRIPPSPRAPPGAEKTPSPAASLGALPAAKPPHPRAAASGTDADLQLHAPKSEMEEVLGRDDGSEEDSDTDTVTATKGTSATDPCKKVSEHDESSNNHGGKGSGREGNPGTPARASKAGSSGQNSGGKKDGGNDGGSKPANEQTEASDGTTRDACRTFFLNRKGSMANRKWKELYEAKNKGLCSVQVTTRNFFVLIPYPVRGAWGGVWRSGKPKMNPNPSPAFDATWVSDDDIATFRAEWAKWESGKYRDGAPADPAVERPPTTAHGKPNPAPRKKDKERDATPSRSTRASASAPTDGGSEDAGSGSGSSHSSGSTSTSTSGSSNGNGSGSGSEAKAGASASSGEGDSRDRDTGDSNSGGGNRGNNGNEHAPRTSTIEENCSLFFYHMHGKLSPAQMQQLREAKACEHCTSQTLSRCWFGLLPQPIPESHWGIWLGETRPTIPAPGRLFGELWQTPADISAFASEWHDWQQGKYKDGPPLLVVKPPGRRCEDKPKSRPDPPTHRDGHPPREALAARGTAPSVDHRGRAGASHPRRGEDPAAEHGTRPRHDRTGSVPPRLEQGGGGTNPHLTGIVPPRGKQGGAEAAPSRDQADDTPLRDGREKGRGAASPPPQRRENQRHRPDEHRQPPAAANQRRHEDTNLGSADQGDGRSDRPEAAKRPRVEEEPTSDRQPRGQQSDEQQSTAGHVVPMPPQTTSGGVVAVYEALLAEATATAQRATAALTATLTAIVSNTALSAAEKMATTAMATSTMVAALAAAAAIEAALRVAQASALGSSTAATRAREDAPPGQVDALAAAPPTPTQGPAGAMTTTPPTPASGQANVTAAAGPSSTPGPIGATPTAPPTPALQSIGAMEPATPVLATGQAKSALQPTTPAHQLPGEGRGAAATATGENSGVPTSRRARRAQAHLARTGSLPLAATRPPGHVTGQQQLPGQGRTEKARQRARRRAAAEQQPRPAGATPAMLRDNLAAQTARLKAARAALHRINTAVRECRFGKGSDDLLDKLCGQRATAQQAEGNALLAVAAADARLRAATEQGPAAGSQEQEDRELSDEEEASDQEEPSSPSPKRKKQSGRDGDEES